MESKNIREFLVKYLSFSPPEKRVSKALQGFLNECGVPHTSFEGVSIKGREFCVRADPTTRHFLVTRKQAVLQKVYKDTSLSFSNFS